MSDVFNQVIPFNTFIRSHGFIVGEVWKRRRIDNVPFRIVTFEDGTSAITAHQLDTLPVIELIAQADILKVGHFNAGGYVIYRNWVNPAEWENIDLDTVIIESHIVSRYGTEEDIDKTIQYCTQENIKNIVCRYRVEETYGVIWEEGDIVKIWGHDSNGNYKKLQFSRVKEWSRLHQKIGSTELLYSFFCLHIQDYSVILNIKTLNFIISLAKDIHATDLSAHKDLYRQSSNHSIIWRYNEHVWADNKLYDENLNEVAVLTQISMNEDKILDFHSRLVAIENFWGICIYELVPKREEGVDCYDIKEVRYRCSKDVSSESVRLRLDSTSLDYAYFDALKKKFIIDTDRIEEEHRRRMKSSDDYYNPWDDYDLINDGLDGEAGAYCGLLD